jgi:hypothetical protein
MLPFVTISLLAIVLGACALRPMTPSTAPATTPAEIARFDLTVSEALAYFEQFAAVTCIGPDGPSADAREWLCTQANAASTNTVRIVGDTLGVSQLIAVSEGETPGGAVSFLIGTVVPIVVPMQDGEDMLYDAVSRPERSGRWLLETVTVELQRHSPARAAFVTPRSTD